MHVAAVAEGLAALGHSVHVLAAPGDGQFPAGGAQWHAEEPPFGVPRFRLLRARRVLQYARDLKPDVIIERYYNFGGEGVLTATRLGALAVLEVNAPIIDYPGSPKRWIDRALLVEPMRRWREWQCAQAGVLVTPLADVVPAFVPRERILEIEWGADTRAFHPDAKGDVPFTRGEGATVVVFAGAFRVWHGAVQLVRAIAQLHARGRTDIHAVLIGDGPEFDRVQREAAGVDGVTLTGPLPHVQLPACLAASDIGVAPFDVPSHAPLTLGFYWSPLKVFEYMAAGLPVIAPNIDRLSRVVRNGREGSLYEVSDPLALAAAIERTADAPDRAELGRAARQRALEEYGWDVHCRRLDRALREALVRKGHHAS